MRKFLFILMVLYSIASIVLAITGHTMHSLFFSGCILLFLIISSIDLALEKLRFIERTMMSLVELRLAEIERSENKQSKE